MHVRFDRIAWGLAAALVLGGCGGAHTGVSSLPQAVKTKHGGHGQLTLRLTLPARTASSARRLPKYISAATQGASVVITAGGVPSEATYTLQPGLAPCAADSAGGSVCTLTATLPGYGATSITVNLYDQPAANGVPGNANLLSTGTITTTIAEGVANVTVPVVLSGVAEGVVAGSTGTLPTGGTAGTTTLTFEATDPDANIILSQDGVVNAGGAALTFTLVAPSAITGITIADLTSGSGYASSLSNVKAGDVIAVASSSSTPQVTGVPIEVLIGTTPVGMLRTPSSVPSVTVPHIIQTDPGSHEIAGVPPWAQLTGLAFGAGVAVLANVNSGGDVAGFSSSGTQVFSCSGGGSGGVYIDHVAVGPGQQLELATVYSDGVAYDLTLADTGLSTSSPNCDLNAQQVTGLNDSAPWLDAANDGAITAAIYTGGQQPSLQVGANASPIDISGDFNSFPTSASMAMWYGQYAIGIAGSNGSPGLFYVSPQGSVTRNSSITPASVAVDNAGNAYVLDTSGNLSKCSLGGTITCGSISVGNASTTNRSIAVGADGDVYVATSSGLVQVNPGDFFAPPVTLGSSNVIDVQASGDGYVYALGSDAMSIFRYP